MDFLSTNTFYNLGITIIHSIWQIGILTFIYFFFIIARKRQNARHKYTFGLLSFAIILICFVFTYQQVRGLNSFVQSISSETMLPKILDVNEVPTSNEIESVDSQDNRTINVFKSFKFQYLLNKLARVIGAIWVLGLFLFAFRKVWAYYYLKRIKNNRYNVRSTKWEDVFGELSKKIKLKRQVNILFSPFIKGPFSFGFFKPIILFPLRFATGLTNEEIRCILLHELAHNLRNDYLFNLFQQVIEALFFYHPGIWWISKNIRTQRELLCDDIVLENDIPAKFYANTLIRLGELQLADANLAVAANRNKNELFARIKYIINRPDFQSKRKGNPLFIIGMVLILIVSGFVIEEKENFLKPTVLSNEIENTLSSFNGSFAFYDLTKDIFYTSNGTKGNTRYPAYSTFKIASSLIALDMGIAEDESYTMSYDSIQYPLPTWMKEHNYFKNWYKEHNIKTALDYSVNWYFMELGTQIGYENMAVYLNRLAYGNQAVSSGDEQSWHNGQLKISAHEQVRFIKSILKLEYDDISKDAQNITIGAIPAQKGTNYTIYGKTGTGQVEDNKFIGWYVGYIETKTHQYAYALNIFADDVNEIPGRMREEMVIDIFTKLGLINN